MKTKLCLFQDTDIKFSLYNDVYKILSSDFPLLFLPIKAFYTFYYSFIHSVMIFVSLSIMSATYLKSYGILEFQLDGKERNIAMLRHSS